MRLKKTAKTTMMKTPSLAAQVSRGPSSVVKKLMAAVNKKFGDGTIMTLGQALNIEVVKLRTGSVSLDVLLRGGTAMNKISIIYGKKSVGKTALMLNQGVNFQLGEFNPKKSHKTADDRERLVVIIDIENATDPIWYTILGLDPDRTLLVSPDSGEQVWDVAADLLDNEDVSVFLGVDSLGALSSAAEMELTEDKSGQLGTKARLINRGLRKVWPRLKTHFIDNHLGHTVCMLNHVTMKLNVMFGSPIDMPGGEGQKHAATTIIYLARADNLKDKDTKENKRFTMIAKLDKDKYGGTEGGDCDITFYRSADKKRGIYPGFDNHFDIIKPSIRAGLITKAGNTLECKIPVTKAGVTTRKLLKAVGMEAFSDLLRGLPESYYEYLYEELIERIVAERDTLLKEKQKIMRAKFAKAVDPIPDEDEEEEDD